MNRLSDKIQEFENSAFRFSRTILGKRCTRRVFPPVAGSTLTSPRTLRSLQARYQTSPRFHGCSQLQIHREPATELFTNLQLALAEFHLNLQLEAQRSTDFSRETRLCTDAIMNRITFHDQP